MKVKAKVDRNPGTKRDVRLIKNEWYDVLDESGSYIFSIHHQKLIKGENGNKNWFSSNDFYTLEELREQKLNEILNES